MEQISLPLTSLAKLAQQALSCDVVVVDIWKSPFGPGRVHSFPQVSDEVVAGVQEINTGPMLSESLVLKRLGFLQIEQVSLASAGNQVGTLSLLSHEEKALDPSLVSAFARYCESVVQFASPVESPEPLSGVDALVLFSESFQELMPKLVEFFDQSLGAKDVGVSVWDEQSGLLKMAAGSFGASDGITDAYSIDPSDLHSNAARIFELQRPFISNQAAGDPGILQNFVGAFKIRNLLAIPLSIAAVPMGVLVLTNKPAGFSSHDLAFCEAVGPRIAVAAQLAHLNELRGFQRRCDQLLSKISLNAIEAVGGPSPTPVLLEEVRILLQAEILYLVGKDFDDGADLNAANADPRKRFRSGNPDADSMQIGDGRREISFPFISRQRCSAPDDPGRELVVGRHSGGRFTHDEETFLSRVASILMLADSADYVRRQNEEILRRRMKQRIADDLHDDVAQLLFAAQMQLETQDDGPTTESAPVENSRNALELIIRASSSLRGAIFGLPEMTSGLLIEDMKELLEDVRREWLLDISFDFDSDFIRDERLPSAIVHELLRGARECLTNVAKHAGSSSAKLSLTRNSGEVSLRIEDDGRGLRDSSHRGYGLSALQRRISEAGGTFRLSSVPQTGTVVTLGFPLTGSAEGTDASVSTS